MKCFNFQNINVVGSLLFLVGCAQVRGLNGGAKDVTPPILLTQSIDSFATNVATRTLVLSFNENVQATAASELLVSPALKQPPTLVCNKKIATLTWNEDLQPNTTYSFEFGGAVADVTEANKAQLNFVFSTGNVLDSNAIVGGVYDALSGGIPEKTIVALYADSLFGKLAYAEKTDSKGGFNFNYLPKTDFYIAAFADLNENRSWDENEAGDFLENAFSTQSNYTVNLRLSPKKIEKIEQEMFKTDSVGSGFLVGAYGLVEKIKLTPTNTNAPFRYGSLANNDTLFFALGGSEMAPPNNKWEGLAFSMNQLQADTLSVFVAKSPKLKKFKFSGVVQQNPNELIRVKAPAYAVLKRSTCDITIGGIQREATLVETNSPLHFTIQTNAAATELTGKGSLRILPGAWETAYGTTNDTLQLNFEFPSLEKQGTLEVQIPLLEDKSFQKFVELRSEKGLLVRKVDYAPTLLFSGLTPGKYYVRLVHDVNRNGLWDIANPKSHIRSEPVNVYAKPIEVRANWSVKVVLN